MPMEPITLALIAGGVLLLASGKKKKPTTDDKKPIDCPPGFIWSDQKQSCIPHLSPDEPPQLHITGDCEAWQMLPSVEGWFSKYAQPKFEALLGGIKAQPTGTDSPDAVGEYTTTAFEMAQAILAQSPIAFATDQFPNFGSMCPIPSTMDDPMVNQPMTELFRFVYVAVEGGIRRFNTTNEAVLTLPEGG
jgi:hypothetical protein